MRLVAGLVPATTGRVAIAGTPVQGPHTDLGIVFQAATLLDWRTVLGNVLLQLELRGLDPKAYEARAIALLKAVGLGDFTGALPRELSGGMKQRAAIVRALVHDPKILLMDEPFGALDALTREQMRIDIEDLWLASRKTVMFITHSIDEAVLLSDRVVVMSPRPGRIERVIPIDLPRPRGLDGRRLPGFAAASDLITGIFLDRGVLHGTRGAFSQSLRTALEPEGPPEGESAPKRVSAEGSPVTRAALIGVAHWHVPLMLRGFASRRPRGGRRLGPGPRTGARARRRPRCDGIRGSRRAARCGRVRLRVRVRSASGHAASCAGRARPAAAAVAREAVRVHGGRGGSAARGSAGRGRAGRRAAGAALRRPRPSPDGLSPATTRRSRSRCASSPARPRATTAGAMRWMLDPAQSGGGAAINLAVHFVDLAILLTGSPVVEVSGLTSAAQHGRAVEDLAVLTLLHGNGAVANVTVGYRFPDAAPFREFRLTMSGRRTYVETDAGGLVVRDMNGAAQHVPVSFDTDAFYADYVRRFVEDIREGRPPETGLAEMARALAVIEAGYRSAREGRRVEVAAG